MARKKESPQKAEMREMMSGYLKDNDIRIKVWSLEVIRKHGLIFIWRKINSL